MKWNKYPDVVPPDSESLTEWGQANIPTLVVVDGDGKIVTPVLYDKVGEIFLVFHEYTCCCGNDVWQVQAWSSDIEEFERIIGMTEEVKKIKEERIAEIEENKKLKEQESVK